MGIYSESYSMEQRTWMARFIPVSCTRNELFILLCTNQIIIIMVNKDQMMLKCLHVLKYVKLSKRYFDDINFLLLA